MRVYYYALTPDDPTSFYRMNGVLPYIDGIYFKDLSDTKVFNWSTFSGADIFIIQRPYSIQHLNIIKLAKDMGVKVIGDYDDDLLEVDFYNPTYEMYEACKPNTIACLKELDEVWVSTMSISNSFKPHNNNIRIIPNAHNDYMMPVNKKVAHNKNNRVAWRGGESHAFDILTNKESLIELINGSPEKQFYFCGARHIDLERSCGENYNVVSGMTIMQFFKYLRELNPQYFIYPLANTPFNNGKSNISWIESTYSGAAFFGNTTLVDQFGYKFMNNLEVLDGDTEAMNSESWEYIKENLLLSKINKTRKELLWSL